MKLAQYDAVASAALESLKSRANEITRLRDDVTHAIYSQTDVVDFLSHTDKACSKTVVQRVMDEMSESGERVFEKEPRKPYKLSLDDVLAIAEKIGVTKYSQKVNGKPFVISFVNLKGGVGKSLCTAMLAHYLVCHERFLLTAPRVLIVDLDPQGSATQQNYPTYKIDDHQYTSIQVLAQDMSIEDIKKYAIKNTEFKNLDIMMAGPEDGFITDMLAQPEYAKGKYVGQLLQDNLISKLEGLYDFIIIDVGPHMDNTLKNVLWAADQMIIPTPPQFYPYDSTLRFLTRLPTLMRELVDKGQSEDDLVDMIPFITSSPISTQKKKRNYAQMEFKGASKTLNKIFDLNTIKHELPFEDTYQRCSDMGHSVFSVTSKDYPGDKKAFERAFISAENWAEEIVDMITVKHEDEQ